MVHADIYRPGAFKNCHKVEKRILPSAHTASHLIICFWRDPASKATVGYPACGGWDLLTAQSVIQLGVILCYIIVMIKGTI